MIFNTGWDGDSTILEEWSELGSRDMDCGSEPDWRGGRVVMRPTERERRSQYTTSTIVQSYVHGLHGLIKNVQSAVYYYQDELGSTTQIANAAGCLLESYTYDVYGKPTILSQVGSVIASSLFGVHDLYAGARWMDDLGLYDMRNRFMSPEMGTFLQTDPIGFKGDASNLYRYCGNDWANRTDPMGLENIDEYTPALEHQIVQASVNSRDAYMAAGDHQGRSQYIIQRADRKGPLFLQTSNGHPTTNVREIFREVREAYKLYGTGEKFRYKEIEKGDAGQGYRAAAAGHFHGDKTGQATRDWSDTDKAAAAGGKDSSGKFIQGRALGLMTESDQKHVRILVPQKEGGSVERKVDAVGNNQSSSSSGRNGDSSPSSSSVEPSGLSVSDPGIMRTTSTHGSPIP